MEDTIQENNKLPQQEGVLMSHDTSFIFVDCVKLGIANFAILTVA